MFSFLKKRKIRKAIQRLKRKHSFMNFDDMKNILIFFSISNLEEVRAIAKDLSQEGKIVHLWTYDDSKNFKEYNSTVLVHVITRKDISITGNISSKAYDDFTKNLYDTIIDLTTEDEYPLQYLLSKNEAKFIIGIRETKYNLYDFVLLKDKDMSISESFLQIKKYLLKIRVATNNL